MTARRYVYLSNGTCACNSTIVLADQEKGAYTASTREELRLLPLPVVELLEPTGT
jgi:hypothetical protein